MHFPFFSRQHPPLPFIPLSGKAISLSLCRVCLWTPQCFSVLGHLMNTQTAVSEAQCSSIEISAGFQQSSLALSLFSPLSLVLLFHFSVRYYWCELLCPWKREHHAKWILYSPFNTGDGCPFTLLHLNVTVKWVYCVCTALWWLWTTGFRISHIPAYGPSIVWFIRLPSFCFYVQCWGNNSPKG